MVALPNYYSREHNFELADLVLENGWSEVIEKWEKVKSLVEK